MAHRDVCPENLRFTQDSIKNSFKKPYDYQRIDDAVDQIGNNQLSPAVFMPLTVVQHKSVLWSLDNRRLWVLRKAGVPTVKVVLVSPKYNRRSEGFFSSLNDPLVRRYSSANYFPRVRGGVRSVGINRGKGSSDGALSRPMPMFIPHPTAVAGAGEANKTHHLKNSTVRIDIPAEVNYEASSICFDRESQPMGHCNVCPKNLRFTQDSIENSLKKPYHYQSSGGAPPPPIPLLLHHPTTVAAAAKANWALPKPTRTAPPPPPPNLRYITVRINLPPPNGSAPPPPMPLILHRPTPVAGAAQANSTLPKYTRPPSPPHYLRDTRVRIDIHPSVPPLPNASHRLSEEIVPLLSNNNSGPSEQKGSDLWGKILNVVRWVMNKGFDFFRLITRWKSR